MVFIMFKKRCVAVFSALLISLGLLLPINASANMAGAASSPKAGSSVSAEGAAEIKPLDMSSPEAFIKDVSDVYGITLKDANKYLSGKNGEFYMTEIDRCLSLFSPEFILETVDFYAYFNYAFVISLEGASTTEYASINIKDKTVLIKLHQNDNPLLNGVTAHGLAHELGHAVHIIAEAYVGERTVQKDMRGFNGKFAYVGDSYERNWRERLHSAVFAYSYGMYSYEEDIATIFERLVYDPDGMAERLSDPKNSALRLKTEYIRNMAYTYVSESCKAIFEPLYRAEEKDAENAAKAA
jgi:hypothetical protein